MSDRYLFRGKRVDNGEWATGYYVHWIDHTMPEGTHYIFSCDCPDNPEDAHMNQYEIDSDTLGQCTGLRDKNGELIFEGDIVKGYRDYIAEVVWIDTCFERYGYNGYCTLKTKEQEIISNIYDNPELLGGEEE